MQTKVSNFLYHHGMHFSTVELADEAVVFREEMQAGLDKRPSSLMMIPSYTRVDNNLPQNKEVIVIDAGGTNLRVATVHFNEKKHPVIQYFSNYPMPGSQGKLSRDVFFETIVQYLEPVLALSSHVGFCFSFPAKILSNGDGEVLGLNKEVLVDDIQGCRLGENINRVLKKHGHEAKTFFVVNDTIATMLGGAASTQNQSYSSHIGYILGTGTNTCYVEKNPAYVECMGGISINIKSGGYKKFLQGDFDKMVDEASSNPGDHLLEKMMSGAYLGTLIHTSVMEAAKEGLFSDDFLESLKNIKQITMSQVDDFCSAPHGTGELAALIQNEENDRLTLYEIIDALYERDARLAIVKLCAILQKCDSGHNPLKPVCVTAEGTFFYKSKLFRNKLDYYNEAFLKRQMNLYCEFIKVDYATLIGAAAAAMSHLKNCFH